ncbi:MAG: tRNA (adenosine(37)-N6)-threonylcarbamoyltransferase complex ATPase subunit type 1 TsaE [Candidatus Omnitrophica bacterium]|nr:tRNA (adenosine(37)-N6)-threonylcarbamoyltransferase complex ATPase subunit type 1 TsaE [Candidatus Omnitrophota bacterium]
MKFNLTLKLKSLSATETKHYGELFSKALSGRDLVVLVGALGGGKTTFTKGILKGLGYRGRVLSPSFTLVREYLTKKFKTYHVDLYRLDKNEALNLGLDDFIYSDNSLTLIEWGDRIDKELDKYIVVKFSYLAESSRQLLISTVGYNKQKIKAIKGLINK